MYIPNEKIHNYYDSSIRNFGDLAFEANNNTLSFGDINDPEKGGYITATKNGSQYTVTHKGVRENPNTGEIEFTAPVTNIATGIDSEKLLVNIIGTIERNNAYILENQIKFNSSVIDQGNTKLLQK